MFVPEMATDRIRDRVREAEVQRLSGSLRTEHVGATGMTTVQRLTYGVLAISLVLGSVLLFSLATALPALGGSGLPGPSHPSVRGKFIPASGTALVFTGADIIPLVVAAGALLVGGLALLALSRRRGTVKS